MASAWQFEVVWGIELAEIEWSKMFYVNVRSSVFEIRRHHGYPALTPSINKQPRQRPNRGADSTFPHMVGLIWNPTTSILCHFIDSISLDRLSVQSSCATWEDNTAFDD
jgi:hypothetical protein